MSSQKINQSNPKEVFGKVLSNGVKNTIYTVVVAIIIALIINVLDWKIFGFILACGFALIRAISILQFLFFTFPLQIFGLILAIKEKFQRRSNLLRTQFYLISGSIVLLIENSISVITILYLYNAYYKVDLLGIFS